MEQTETAQTTNLWSGKIWPTLRPHVIDFLHFCARLIKKGAQLFWKKYLEPMPSRLIYYGLAAIVLLFELYVGLLALGASVNYEASRKTAALSVAELLEQGRRDRIVSALRVGDLLVTDDKPCYIVQITQDYTSRFYCQTSMAATALAYESDGVLDPRVTIVSSTDENWRKYMMVILELSKPAPPPPPPAVPIAVSPKSAPLVQF